MTEVLRFHDEGVVITLDVTVQTRESMVWFPRLTVHSPQHYRITPSQKIIQEVVANVTVKQWRSTLRSYRLSELLHQTMGFLSLRFEKPALLNDRRDVFFEVIQ